MIDWEDSFDLEALASQMKSDGDGGADRHAMRTLSLLRRRGMMEFELYEEPGTDLFGEADTSIADTDDADWESGAGNR